MPVSLASGVPSAKVPKSHGRIGTRPPTRRRVRGWCRGPDAPRRGTGNDYGDHQIGLVHARSWIVSGRLPSVQEVGLGSDTASQSV